MFQLRVHYCRITFHLHAQATKVDADAYRTIIKCATVFVSYITAWCAQPARLMPAAI